MSTEPQGRQNGTAIRVIRKLSKVSTAQLAGAVGIHEQALRNIENNSRPASDPVINAIAGYFGIPVEAITRNVLLVAA